MQNIDCDICGCLVDYEKFKYCPTCMRAYHQSCVRQSIIFCGWCDQKTCQVCNNSEGLMIETYTNQAHPVCLQLYRQYRNQYNYYKKKKLVKPLTDRTDKSCMVCSNKQAFITCLGKGCNVAIHPFCLIRSEHKKSLCWPKTSPNFDVEQFKQESAYQNILRFISLNQSMKQQAGEQFLPQLLNYVDQLKRPNLKRFFRFKCPAHSTENENLEPVQFEQSTFNYKSINKDLQKFDVLSGLGKPNLQDLLIFYNIVQSNLQAVDQRIQLNILQFLWSIGFGFDIIHMVKHPALIEPLQRYTLQGKCEAYLLQKIGDSQIGFEVFICLLESINIIKRDRELHAYTQLMKNSIVLLIKETKLSSIQRKEVQFLKDYLPFNYHNLFQQYLTDLDTPTEQQEAIHLPNKLSRVKSLQLDGQQIIKVFKPEMLSTTLIDFFISFFTSFAIRVPDFIKIESVFLSGLEYPISKEQYQDFTSQRESIIIYPRCFQQHWSLTVFINLNQTDSLNQQRILIYNSYYPECDQSLLQETNWMVEFIKNNIPNSDPLKQQKLKALNNIKIQFIKIPHQQNGHDCGVATLECLLRSILEPEFLVNSNQYPSNTWPPDGYYMLIRCLLMNLLEDLQNLKNLSQALQIMVAQEYAKRFLAYRQNIMIKYSNELWKQLAKFKNSQIFEFVQKLLESKPNIEVESLQQENVDDIYSSTIQRNEVDVDEKLQVQNQDQVGVQNQERQNEKVYVSTQMIINAFEAYCKKLQHKEADSKRSNKKIITNAQLINYIYIDEVKTHLEQHPYRLEVIQSLESDFEIVSMSSGLKLILDVRDTDQIFILVGITLYENVPTVIFDQYRELLKKKGYQKQTYYMVKQGKPIENL